MLQSNPTRGGSETMKTKYTPFQTAELESVFCTITQILEWSQQYQSSHSHFQGSWGKTVPPSRLLFWSENTKLTHCLFSQIVTDCGEVLCLVLLRWNPGGFGKFFAFERIWLSSSSGMGDAFSLKLFLFWVGEGEPRYRTSDCTSLFPKMHK